LHRESRRPRRIIHSTRGGGLLDLASTTHGALDIRSLLSKLMFRLVCISAYTEAAAVYHCVVVYRKPAELHSKPDAVLVRQALLHGCVVKC